MGVGAGAKCRGAGAKSCYLLRAMIFWRTPFSALLAIALVLTLVNGCSGKDSDGEPGSGGSSDGLGGKSDGLGGATALGGQLNRGGIPNSSGGSAGEVGQSRGGEPGTGATGGEGPESGGAGGAG